MIICEKAKRFNTFTGQPIEVWVEKEIRCDYTGEVLDTDNMYCIYNLNYDGQDPCFGAGGDEFHFGQDAKIDIYSFISQPYHFLSEGGSDSIEQIAEWQMMQEALKNCKKKDSIWHRCYTFDAMCRVSRIRIAKAMIVNGTVTPEQLEVQR